MNIDLDSSDHPIAKLAPGQLGVWVVESETEFQVGQVVPVTVPCPTCGGRTWHTAGGHDPMDCGRCDVTGRLSIGKGTVEAVGAIVRYDDWVVGHMVTGETQPNCIVVHGRVAILVGADGRGKRAVDLGPNPEQYVGTHYGVIVRRQS